MTRKLLGYRDLTAFEAEGLRIAKESKHKRTSTYGDEILFLLASLYLLNSTSPSSMNVAIAFLWLSILSQLAIIGSMTLMGSKYVNALDILRNSKSLVIAERGPLWMTRLIALLSVTAVVAYSLASAGAIFTSVVLVLVRIAAGVTEDVFGKAVLKWLEKLGHDELTGLNSVPSVELKLGVSFGPTAANQDTRELIGIKAGESVMIESGGNHVIREVFKVPAQVASRSNGIIFISIADLTELGLTPDTIQNNPQIKVKVRRAE